MEALKEKYPISKKFYRVSFPDLHPNLSATFGVVSNYF